MHEDNATPLLGQSTAMRALLQSLEQLAATDATVFVRGESGTGKELFASELHRLSSRSEHRFVVVRCASVPRDLLESELFGHEAGAYPGAERRYIGALEQANGGTVLLDEVCELDPRLQADILRFLQTRTLRRVGGTEPVEVDVRIVAATHGDPAEATRSGRLREDLYYRLHVVSVDIPPLRERQSDIIVLAESFLDRFARKYGKSFSGFGDGALAALELHDWPGNVRELSNAVERAVVLNAGPQVSVHMLPGTVRASAAQERREAAAAVAVAPATNGRSNGNAVASDEILPFTEVERREILRALRICDGNVSATAQRLKLGQATVYRKIKKYGISLRRGVRTTVASSGS